MKYLLYILLILSSFWSCHESTPNRTEIGEEGIIKYEKGTSKYAYKYHKALELINKGQLNDAEKIYLELMKIDSNNIEIIHIGLGTINMLKNDYFYAINHYSKAISLNNKCYEGYLGLASVYYNQNHYSKALANYKIAKTIAPDRPDAYWGLSIAFDHLNEPDSSEYYAKEFLKLAPNSKYRKLLIKDKTLPNKN